MVLGFLWKLRACVRKLCTNEQEDNNESTHNDYECNWFNNQEVQSIKRRIIGNTKPLSNEIYCQNIPEGQKGKMSYFPCYIKLSKTVNF